MNYVRVGGYIPPQPIEDYNDLPNIPVHNQDLAVSGFTPVANSYYRHIGATTDTFTQGVIYLYNGTGYAALDGAAVNNGTLTIQKNGTNVATFGANQSSSVTANITVPTKASDVDALPISGGTITGNLIVGGNLTINGTTTTVDSTTLQVKDKLIEVAHGNTTTLTTPAGLVAPKYDGTNSGALVFDSTGTAYVGDVTFKDGNIDVANSGLQPLATRTGLVGGNLVQYDSSALTLKDSGKKISDLALKTDISGLMPKKGGTFTGEVKFGSTENFQGYYIKRMIGSLGVGTRYADLDSSYKDGTWHRMWRLRFPSDSNFWGKIKITLYGGYSSFNASGVMSKSITCNFNTSSIYNNVGCYDGLGVNVEQDFRISEAIWNDTANAWEVLIWQKNLNGNNSPTIMLECWTTNNTNYINAFNGITAQTVELTQSTSYSAQKASPTGGTKTVTWATLPVYENPLGEEIATVAMLKDKQDKITSSNKLSSSLVDGLGAAAAKAVDTAITANSTSTNLPTSKAVEDRINAHSGIDKVGTITGINMNGASKGTSGVVDLGTVITAHQDISGKANLSGGNTFSGLQTINAPTDVSGSEQTTMKVKTSNGGAIIFGKEGPNSGTMIRLDQADGTCRLRFRSSKTAGAMVWEQPEHGAKLHVDLGKDGSDKHRVTFPSRAGTLALTSQIPTNYVTTDTDWQEITSTKKFFRDQLIIANEIDIGASAPAPEANQYRYIDFLDKNDKRIGIVGASIDKNKCYGAYLQAGNVASMGVLSTPDGFGYSYGPIPPDKDNTNKLATTSWTGRRYKSIADFGFTSQTTVKAIVQKIIDNWYEYCTFACTNDNFNNFSDTPDGYGTLIIEVGSNALRPLISFTKQIGNSNSYKHWQANIVRGENNQVTEIQWYQVITTKNFSLSGTTLTITL